MPSDTHTHWPDGFKGAPARHVHRYKDVRHSHNFYSDADYAEGRRYHAGKTLEFQGLYGGAAGRAFLEHLRQTEVTVVGSFDEVTANVARALLGLDKVCCHDGSCAYCQGWRRYWERVKATANRRYFNPFGKRRPLPPQQARYEARKAGDPLAPARRRLRPRYAGETLTEYTCGCVRNDRNECRLNCARDGCVLMSGTRTVKDQWRAGHVPLAQGCEWSTAPLGDRCDDLALHAVWINDRTGVKHYCDKHVKMYERKLNAALREHQQKKERAEGASVQIGDERLREIRRYGQQQGRRAAAAAVTVLTRDAVSRFGPCGPEEMAMLGAALRRGFFDGLRRRMHTRVNDFWWERRYARRLHDLQGVRRGLAARKAGRMRPWGEIKEELGLPEEPDV